MIDRLLLTAHCPVCGADADDLAGDRAQVAQALDSAVQSLAGIVTRIESSLVVWRTERHDAAEALREVGHLLQVLRSRLAGEVE
jgi:hypothetical protein